MRQKTNDSTVAKRAYSIIEAASVCGLSRATLYRLIADGKLSTLKIGARRLVPVGAVEALLNVEVPK